MMLGIRPSTDYSLLFQTIPDDSRRFQTIRLPFSPNRTVFPRPKRAGITGLAIADTSTSLARAEYAKGFRRLAESHAGGLDGDRTHDLLFRRQTLYPLSYKPVRQTTLHCLEMKATLFTEKRSSNLGSLLRKHSYGGSFDSTPNPRGEITGIERGRNER